MFFVGSAAQDGRVNISPKGLDSLRVMGPNRVVWRNLTGSGNETSAHLREVNRITLMFCAVEGPPMILRLYGSAETIHPRDEKWEELNGLFAPAVNARQLYDVTVDLVQTSCGYAVPFFDFVSERDTLTKSAEKKGPDGIKAYWAEKNTESIDGMPTGIFE